MELFGDVTIQVALVALQKVSCARLRGSPKLDPSTPQNAATVVTSATVRRQIGRQVSPILINFRLRLLLD